MTVVVPPPAGRYSSNPQSWVPSTNFWEGHRGRCAVVVHINEGSFEGSIRYMQQNGTSAHFEVGLAGRIAQLVNVNDSAWCNGLSWVREARRWRCPHGKFVTPTWPTLAQTTENPNWLTVSIENEGFSGRPMPSAQFNANVELLVWLGLRFPSFLPYTVGQTLLGHRHIDPLDKSNCPGAGVDLEAMAQAANRALGLRAAWLDAWAARGVPLPEGQIGWAIPQLYKDHAAALGACVASETYLHPGFSVAVFERGFIYYVRADGRAVVELVNLGL